jgi:predicted transcriptional regulator
MTETAKPSPTELALLKQLWSRGELSARELHDAAAQELDWTFSSTRRTLDRMLEKGLVRRRDSHGVQVFAAAAGKTATLAALARDFMTRVLELTEPLPAATFADSRLLTDADIEELQALLDGSAEDRKDK